MTHAIPPERVHALNTNAVAKRGAFVLYWMIAARRTSHSFALDRAIAWAAKLGRPLVVLEALRVGHRWNSARIHRFVLDGMAANERALRDRGALYYPYVEPAPGAGSGLVEALADHAAVVVTDEFPCFFLPRMAAALGRRVDVRVEAVDSNGLLPLRATDAVYPSAYAFRRFLQKSLRPHLARFPSADPLATAALPPPDALPRAIETRWPRADAALLAPDGDLSALPIDHGVAACSRRGGSDAGALELERFLKHRLARYAAQRSEPSADASSGLSPYLHFGHVSAHAVFAALAAWEGWTIDALATTSAGKKSGFWNMGESAEAFVDEFVTWRELGLNFCSKRDDYDRFESLPAWAQATLEKHASDPREHVYTRAELAAGATHDPLWNAAQTQLAREGVIHNYLRMLWGKKILQWSPDPRTALAHMIELNNQLALDGRDPNSYSGIFWVLGRYDRPWGPERKIFGSVRYMTSENTARKLDVGAYVARYASGTERGLTSAT